jgi:hypothetical protein
VSASTYSDLAAHAGHHVTVVLYAEENAAVECETCSVVLLDFARDEEMGVGELATLAEQRGISVAQLEQDAATRSREPHESNRTAAPDPGAAAPIGP